jgi:UDP:flavonoid glycosyltransferase YjiC (YdhE family)
VKQRARILVGTYQGYPGDTETPFLRPILTKLIEHGHTLRIIFGPGVRQTRLPVSDRLLRRLADLGATMVPFREPELHPLDNLPPVRGLVGGWIPAKFQGIPRQAQTILWAPAWAENVAAELRRLPADMVLADYVLLGALAAAEAARVPCVALQHTVGMRPSAALPPYGTGWQPGRSPLGKARDVLGNLVLENLYRRNGLSPLNAARSGLGLAPLQSAFEQYDRISRVLTLVSSSLDFPRRKLPANMRFVGIPMYGYGPSTWQAPWPLQDGGRPLVVVSLSTLPQGQAALLRSVLLALSRLDVWGLVTLGPSLDPADFVAPPNAVLERFVSHSAVLPLAAALVTQCGIGTVTKGLAYGVPLVCAPILADQPDNAARVVARGAGIYVPSDASPERIGAAIQRVLNDPKFRRAAQQLGAAIAREGDPVDNAISAIEDVLPPVPVG